MKTQYEVWLNARHPKTLESVATMRVFAHPDRLRAERVMEHADEEFVIVANLMRIWQPGAIVSSEMHYGVAPTLTAYRALQERVVHLEKLRPHWAQGHTSDGVAAQTATNALQTLWDGLGAVNQTEAVAKLGELLKAAQDAPMEFGPLMGTRNLVNTPKARITGMPAAFGTPYGTKRDASGQIVSVQHVPPPEVQS